MIWGNNYAQNGIGTLHYSIAKEREIFGVFPPLVWLTEDI